MYVIAIQLLLFLSFSKCTNILCNNLRLNRTIAHELAGSKNWRKRKNFLNASKSERWKKNSSWRRMSGLECVYNSEINWKFGLALVASYLTLFDECSNSKPCLTCQKKYSFVFRASFFCRVSVIRVFWHEKILKIAKAVGERKRRRRKSECPHLGKAEQQDIIKPLWLMYLLDLTSTLSDENRK